MISKKNIGTLKVKSKFYEDDIELVSEALAYLKFVPFKVEHDFMRDEFVMSGYTEAFAKVPPYEIAPEYNLMIHEAPDGEFSHAEVIAV